MITNYRSYRSADPQHNFNLNLNHPSTSILSSLLEVAVAVGREIGGILILHPCGY